MVDPEVLKEQEEKRDAHAVISDGASHGDVEQLHRANVHGMLDFIKMLEKAGIEEPNLLQVPGSIDHAGGGDRQASLASRDPLSAPPKTEQP